MSSREQKDEGISLEVQEELCQDYADEKGLVVVKRWVVDEPASKPGRKGFNAMLAYAEKNRVEHILVQSTDRLHRNKKDEIRIDEMVEAGFNFHMVADKKIYTENEEGIDRTLQEIQGVLGRHEIRELKRRIKRALKKKLEDGEYPGLAPVGYISIAGDKKRPRQIKQSSDAPLVKKFLETFNTGKHSPAEMVIVAEKLGLKSSRGNPLSLMSVKYILKNMFYCGEWSWEYKGKKKEKETYAGKADGLWEPIVSKRLVLKNIELMKKFTLKYAKSKGKRFKFKGLLHCGSCDSTLFGMEVERHYISTKTKEKKHFQKIYYRCMGKAQKEECDMPNFPEQVIEDELLKNIGYLEFNNDVWKQMRKNLFEMDTKEMLTAERKTLHSERTKIETMEDRLYDDLVKGTIDESFYKRKNMEIRKRKEQVTERLEELEIEIEMWAEGTARIIDMVDAIKGFKEKFQKADDKTKQDMIKLMTERVVTHAYTGDSERIDKKLAKGVDFIWNDEFQALFDLGVIKKVDEQVKKLTPKHGPKTPGSKSFLNDKKGNRQHYLKKKLPVHIIFR